jgi:hypothetical protein
LSDAKIINIISQPAETQNLYAAGEIELRMENGEWRIESE